MTRVNREGREKAGQKALREENLGTRRTRMTRMMTRREQNTGRGVIQGMFQRIQKEQMTDLEIQVEDDIQTQEENQGTADKWIRTIQE